MDLPAICAPGLAVQAESELIPEGLYESSSVSAAADRESKERNASILKGR
jgi:hypothetical protein